MAHSNKTTVAAYIASLSKDRQMIVRAIRKTVRASLPSGYRESMNWGMIAYEIPLKRYPTTYNGQPLLYAAIASQKSYVSVYLMGAYVNSKENAWFVKEYKKTGKKLNMGKCCLRLKNMEEIPFDLIGRAIARTTVDQYIRRYEKARSK